jgi:hypothetical protein
MKAETKARASFPRKRESQIHFQCVSWEGKAEVPAFAGMTLEVSGSAVCFGLL